MKIAFLSRRCRCPDDCGLQISLLSMNLTRHHADWLSLVEVSGPFVSLSVLQEVFPFPRWMRCSLCNTLATIESGVFKLIQDPYRPDHTAFVHPGCQVAKSGKPPSALSVRFLLACREGHLTDFPWLSFVHQGNVPCEAAQLTLREFGASGDASDIIVKCHSCGSKRRMSDAFDAQSVPLPLSALSIPRATDKLSKQIEEQWAELGVARYKALAAMLASLRPKPPVNAAIVTWIVPFWCRPSPSREPPFLITSPDGGVK